MKKKTMILAVMLAGVVGLSGCKAWDVVCDVLAVGTTKVEKDSGPKVDLEGVTPEVKDDDSMEEGSTAEHESDKNDTNKSNTKNETTDKKRVTVPSETPTPEPSHTPMPTPEEKKQVDENGHMITCISPVNVRDAASSQSRVIGELAKGDKVEKLGEDGGWIKIRYKGQEAWVYEDYMSEKNSRKEEKETDETKSDHTKDTEETKDSNL